MKTVLITIFLHLALNCSAQILDYAYQYVPETKFVVYPDSLNNDPTTFTNQDWLGFNIILLKQYLFHLQCCNQSYDIISVFPEDKKGVLLDYFTRNKIVQIDEGVSSGVPYDLVRKNKLAIKDKEVSNLVKRIRRELRRIKKYTRR
jgi:hypothetical protein